jgi:hypothetical protein
VRALQAREAHDVVALRLPVLPLVQGLLAAVSGLPRPPVAAPPSPIAYRTSYEIRASNPNEDVVLAALAVLTAQVGPWAAAAKLFGGR